MSLVYKQCQGVCGRVKEMPDHKTYCDKCWRKLQRQRNRERADAARQEGWQAGWTAGFEAGHDAALQERGEAS
jgi:hypothetical protein